MRLLEYGEDGELSITADLVGEDTIPPYAILSHRWGEDGEEVTFEDVASNASKDKSGYKKIHFCGEQARQDGLQYFWVDTCCIKKANKAELSHAIQSMFRWYRNAARCYVYLSDVSASPHETEEEASPLSDLSASPHGTDEEASLPLWDSDFRESKWFTRGWTLQELLAPSSVEFFSREWEKLGDKNSLKSQIHEVTSIPHLVLEGAPLSQFSVSERFRWKQNRHTKLKEDGAYSLSGILDVDIAPVYGEGAEEAFRRLHAKIRKLENCLRDLRPTDPRNDKTRIEATKGGLLEGSYRWVFNNSSFQQWHNDPQSQLLWIKGDPGKGKTMLLCGIINELQKLKLQKWIARTTLVSYFFCQATDSRINSGVAVLRGLLYLLVSQQPSLISHIRKYDHAGKTMFEDTNAWVALTEIFADVLRDPSLSTTYLIIDALDECVTDLPKLLHFVAKQSPASSRVKWIVSSRNWPSIEEQLERAGHKVRLSLELNSESVSAAVGIFIQQKVSQLAQQKKYDKQTQNAVLERLTSTANDTFLWVALVCQDLQATAKRNVLKKLDLFPPGLDALYERMMQQISKSDDAKLCKQMLALIALVYRPITLKELVALVEQLEDIADDLELREIIGFCGSFLTLRDDTVYFVHQSAKDFLLAQEEIFPSGREDVHHTIFTRSLEVMSKTLQRDMYGLKAPGYHVDDVKHPYPDPLAASRYSCVYWIDHLCKSNPVEDLQDKGVVHVFLREKYLYWLEALSLCKSIPKGVVSIRDLQLLVQGKGETSLFTKLVHDAHRFIMSHKGAIEGSPLQAYVSALLFSPTKSLVRRLFYHEEPEGITIKLAMGDGWSACLQTLEGHSNWVISVAFSPDSTWLASASYDSTVKIWDASSGACLQTLEGHSSHVTSVAFSHDSTRLASASSDVKIWDASSGACLHTLEFYSGSVAFSHDSTRLASAWDTAKIWDASSGACLQTIGGKMGGITSVAFSHNSTCLASLSNFNDIVNIWDARSGACLQTLKGYSGSGTSVAFSHDSTLLASASKDSIINIYNTRSGACLQTLKDHSSYVTFAAFSHNLTWLASVSLDNTVKIWDVSSGVCLQTLKGHSDQITSVAFSHDSTRLASASYDSIVKIWDASRGARLQTLEGHSCTVTSVAFSHDLTRLASASEDSTVKIWDASSGACLQTLEVHKYVTSIAFSHDSTRLASTSWDSTVKIWDASNGAYLLTLEVYSNEVSSGYFLFGNKVTSVAFSHDSTWLASASLEDRTVRIWEASSGACLQKLEGHSSHVTSVAFSHDSTWLASASADNSIKIWDASSGACLQTLSTGRALHKLSFDSTGSCLYTDMGTIAISSSEVSSMMDLGIGISSDNTWITHGGKTMLWLPSEYRPSCSSICGSTVGIGSGSGRVWLCSINVLHKRAATPSELSYPVAKRNCN